MRGSRGVAFWEKSDLGKLNHGHEVVGTLRASGGTGHRKIARRRRSLPTGGA